MRALAKVKTLVMYTIKNYIENLSKIARDNSNMGSRVNNTTFMSTAYSEVANYFSGTFLFETMIKSKDQILMNCAILRKFTHELLRRGPGSRMKLIKYTDNISRKHSNMGPIISYSRTFHERGQVPGLCTIMGQGKMGGAGVSSRVRAAVVSRSNSWTFGSGYLFLSAMGRQSKYCIGFEVRFHAVRQNNCAIRCSWTGGPPERTSENGNGLNNYRTPCKGLRNEDHKVAE